MTIAGAHKTQRTYKIKSHKAPVAASPAELPVTWTHVPLVPQVALVGHLDGMPIAVIDQIGSAGFRAGLCNGKSVGVFRTLEECKQAVIAAIQNAKTSVAPA